MKNCRLGLLFCLFALAGCQLDEFVASSDSGSIINGGASYGGEPLRVGTFNIRNSGGDKGTSNGWGKRKEDLAAFIGELEPDIMGLQEVLPDQAKYLKETLTAYELTGDHRGKDRKSSEACTVMYRKARFDCLTNGTFWLSETPDKPASKSWGTSLPRICTFVILEEKDSRCRLAFANAHTDHISEEAREKGLELIVQRLGELCPGTPMILVGDHNCLETEKPALTAGTLLTNSFYASKTTPKGPFRTYNGWKVLKNDEEISAKEAIALAKEERNAEGYQEKCRGKRIDYVYVSADIEVLNNECHNKKRPGKELYFSDHFPLTSDIVVPKQEPLAR